MNELNFYAFADESSPFIDGQIEALNRNGFNGVEMRTVDQISISDITVEKAKEVKKKFDHAGLKIWSLGSPLGKTEIGTDNFAEHLEKVKHTVELANVLGTENIRMFSFYIPEGHRPESYRSEIIDRLIQMTEIAKKSGVYLCHENEKKIYGDTAERCLDLLTAVPALKAIFDPANFIQCEVDTRKAWELLKDKVYYLHVKDALADGNVVPAGKGVGNLQYIIEDFVKRGGKNFTIEPHLTVFSALKSLEREGDKIQVGNVYTYRSKPEAFDVACTEFKKIVSNIKQ